MQSRPILLLLFLLPLRLCMIPGAAGQSFSFEVPQTALSDTLGSEIIFQGSFTNLSPLPLTMIFVRTLNDLPAGWESSLCLDACYPSWIDTIATTSDFGSSPLQPAETRQFSLHVYPQLNAGTAFIRVLAVDFRNPTDSIGILFTATGVPVGVAGDAPLPDHAVLLQNYPNPFNPTTQIRFALPGALPHPVTLRVVDLLGRTVRTLADGPPTPGVHQVTFDGHDLPGGVYFCLLTVGSHVYSRRLLLLR